MDSCAASAVCDAVVKHVIPILGSLTSFGIFLSSWRPIHQVAEFQLLGAFNSLPNALLAVNCLSWFLYGLFVKNYYITIPNLIGLEFSLYYLLLVYHLHSGSQRSTLRLVLMGGCAIVCLSSAIAFGSLSPSSARHTLGITSVTALILFYSSPLSNFAHVIKEKDARSIQPGLALATGVNSILWGCYGFAISDLYVSLPNVLGILSVITQFILLHIYKDSRKGPREEIVEDTTISREDSTEKVPEP